MHLQKNYYLLGNYLQSCCELCVFKDSEKVEDFFKREN